MMADTRSAMLFCGYLSADQGIQNVSRAKDQKKLNENSYDYFRLWQAAARENNYPYTERILQKLIE